jgi:uncharacterized protein (TIGR03437 family)
MKFAGFTLALAGIFAGSALAQTPTVTGLLNNYSNTLPGLPNYGIAQGSIFVIYGSNFTSSQFGLQAPPLQSTLGGASINVTVNGTSTSPLFYYLFPTQIAAVLPSATPVGTGTITVTTASGTSTAFPIQVVASAFGLLTTNNGTGPAQGYDANLNPNDQYTLFDFSAAANPGDILLLWGTGLGAVENDATGVAVSGPVTVYIGGTAVTPLYAGRSGFTGLDQINVQVPTGALGCYVSVVVQAGSNVSNFGTLPVAAQGGRTCTDANNPLTSSLLSGLSQKNTFSIGVVSLSETTSQAESIDGITVSPGGTTDIGSAGFLTLTASQINSGAYTTASIGSCVASFYNASLTSQSAPELFNFTFLNAGPDINITGPDGAIAMPLSTATVEGTTFYGYATPQSDTSFIPAAGGTFSFNNGSGTSQVGPFTAQLQLTSPLVWTNMSKTSTVTRSNGLTVNWTGGDAGTYVSITGLSVGFITPGDTSDFVAGTFTCEAPAQAGSFTVPAAVLSELPASATIDGASFSSLSVANVTNPVTFTATGLDVGLALATFEDTITVTYQ